MKKLYAFVRSGSVRSVFILTVVMTGLLFMLGMWQNMATVAALDDPGQPQQSLYHLQVTGTLTPAAYFPIVRRDLTPTPTATPTTPPDFFFDDFSNTNSGWITGTAGECKYEYAGGVYRITVTDNNVRCIAFNTRIGKKPNGTFSVRVRRTTPSDRLVLIGLFFGAGSDATKKRWALEIRPQRVDCDGKQRGFYWLSYIDGSTKLVGDACSDEIRTGTDEWNDLRITRDSNDINVYINNDFQEDYNNDRLREEGYFNLEVVSNYEDASDSRPVIVEFDDFRIQ